MVQLHKRMVQVHKRMVQVHKRMVQVHKRMVRSHKSRQRGAAMAEMAILAPVMITMWIGIDYFRSGYARRLEAIAQSHAQAWRLAYSNDGSCFANKEPWAGFSGENDINNTGEKGAQAGAAFQSNTSSSMFSYAHASVSATMPTRAARWDGGSAGEVKGGTYILCNEVVPATSTLAGRGSSTDGKDRFADQDVLRPLWSWISSLF
jgi:hypothetical protein